MRRFCALATVVAMSLALGGCGGSTSTSNSAAKSGAVESYAESAYDGYADSDYDNDYDNGMDYSAEYEGDVGVSEPAAAESADADENLKIVRTADIELRSRDFDATNVALTGVISGKGCRVMRDNLWSADYNGSYRVREVTLTIASERLDDLVESLTSIDGAQVQSSEISADDQTATYVDRERRISLVQREYDYYNQLVDQVSEPSERQAYVSRMFELLGELETLRGENADVDRRVAESTVNLRLREDTALSDRSYASGTDVGQELVDTFVTLPGNIVVALAWVLVIIMRVLPMVLVIALIAWPIVAHVRKRRAERGDGSDESSVSPSHMGRKGRRHGNRRRHERVEDGVDADETDEVDDVDSVNGDVGDDIDDIDDADDADDGDDEVVEVRTEDVVTEDVPRANTMDVGRIMTFGTHGPGLDDGARDGGSGWDNVPDVPDTFGANATGRRGTS